jgi:CRP-like cAMP-binding protein
MQSGHPQSRLVRRLKAAVELSDADARLIARLPMKVRNFHADCEIAGEGETSNECILLVDGFLCSQKRTGDGQRQLLSFYVPGDIPDLHALYLPTSDHSLATVEAAVIASIPHSALREAFAESSNLNAIFMREVMVDASIHREWLLNIGTREALARVAHLLCELAARLTAVGLARNLTFTFPATQSDIADACGMSTVHANRVIQELRARGLIQWRDKMIKILDWDALAGAGDFLPDYLYLAERARGDSVKVQAVAEPVGPATGAKSLPT